MNESFNDSLLWLKPFQSKLNFKLTDVTATDGGQTLCSVTLRDRRRLLFRRDNAQESWEFLGDLAQLIKIAKQSNVSSVAEITTFVREMCGKKHKKLSESIILKEKKSEFEKLKDNKVPLTDEERATVKAEKAEWSNNDSAVWKSKDPKTLKVTFVTHTHRAYNTAPTLKGAISRYHNFIKGTA